MIGLTNEQTERQIEITILYIIIYLVILGKQAPPPMWDIFFLSKKKPYSKSGRPQIKRIIFTQTKIYSSCLHKPNFQIKKDCAFLQRVYSSSNLYPTLTLKRNLVSVNFLSKLFKTQVQEKGQLRHNFFQATFSLFSIVKSNFSTFS